MYMYIKFNAFFVYIFLFDLLQCMQFIYVNSVKKNSDESCLLSYNLEKKKKQNGNETKVIIF